jgi:hypothetical protein
VPWQSAGEQAGDGRGTNGQLPMQLHPSASAMQGGIADRPLSAAGFKWHSSGCTTLSSHLALGTVPEEEEPALLLEDLLPAMRNCWRVAVSMALGRGAGGGRGDFKIWQCHRIRVDGWRELRQSSMLLLLLH